MAILELEFAEEKLTDSFLSSPSSPAAGDTTIGNILTSITNGSYQCSVHLHCCGVC